MTPTKSVHARLERRRAEEANALVRAQVQAADQDAVPDSDLTPLGFALFIGSVVVVIGLAALALTGRL